MESKRKAKQKQNGSKSKTNVNDNENVNVNVNENDNNNDNAVGDSCVDGLQKVIEFYNKNIGLITPYGIEIFEDYAKEMDIDVIIYAMKISIEADKRNIKYIKAILNNWTKKGIKKLVDAQKESKQKKTTMPEQREYDNLDFLYANGKGE